MPVLLVHIGSDGDGWPVPDLASQRGALLHCTFYTRHPHLKGTETIPETMSNSDTEHLITVSFRKLCRVPQMTADWTMEKIAVIRGLYENPGTAYSHHPFKCLKNTYIQM